MTLREDVANAIYDVMLDYVDADGVQVASGASADDVLSVVRDRLLSDQAAEAARRRMLAIGVDFLPGDVDQCIAAAWAAAIEGGLDA